MDKSNQLVISSHQTNENITIILKQLKNIVNEHIWFKDFDTTNWFNINPLNLLNLTNKYHAKYQLITSPNPPNIEDKRFNTKDWQIAPFNLIAHLYLYNCSLWLDLVNLLNITQTKARLRLEFLIEQLLAAVSPANNLFTNPKALLNAYHTGGLSLVIGANYLTQDLLEGKIRQCDKKAFKVGENLAITKGEVIFSNELFELIQYYPTSKNQYQKPIFIVPPCINKYYILDLQPHNSLIKHLVDYGFMVFVMSWRNFSPNQANLTIDNFIQDGVITGLRTVRAITGVKNINCVGFCIGGTILTLALAVLAQRSDQQINSLTLLTTMLDFSDTGILDIFIDEQFVSLCEKLVGGFALNQSQIFSGQIMANTFSLLRPNQLWWNYYVDKFLNGNQPKALDLLFWNNDSTNLPGKFFCWYLRNAYLTKALQTGTINICNQKINFSNIKAPTYLFASQQDHIVPWQSAYASWKILAGNCKFVLGSSGHIAGVINPPAANKREFWTNINLEQKPENWLDKATRHDGSWWNDWFIWLANLSNEQVISKIPGNSEYPPIKPAPGSYVLE